MNLRALRLLTGLTVALVAGLGSAWGLSACASGGSLSQQVGQSVSSAVSGAQSERSTTTAAGNAAAVASGTTGRAPPTTSASKATAQTPQTTTAQRTTTVTETARGTIATKTQTATASASTSTSTTSHPAVVNVVPTSTTGSGSGSVPWWGWLLIGLGVAGVVIGGVLIARSGRRRSNGATGGGSSDVPHQGDLAVHGDGSDEQRRPGASP